MGEKTMTVQERVLTSLYLEQLRVIKENEKSHKEITGKREKEKGYE